MHFTQVDNVFIGVLSYQQVIIFYSTLILPACIIIIYLVSTTNMSIRINRSNIPGHEEYYITFQHQPIHFRCETHISDQPQLPSNHSIKIDDDLTIENYYCYNNQNQLIKITKIFVGSETVTLTDRITVYRDEPTTQKPKEKIDMSHPLSVIAQTQSSEKKEKTTKRIQQFLDKFKSWLTENHAQLAEVLVEIMMNSSSESQIKEGVNAHEKLRESFFKFRMQVSAGRNRTKFRQILSEWHKAFLPSHKKFLKNEHYLNNILSGVLSK